MLPTALTHLRAAIRRTTNADARFVAAAAELDAIEQMLDSARQSSGYGYEQNLKQAANNTLAINENFSKQAINAGVTSGGGGRCPKCGIDW